MPWPRSSCRARAPGCATCWWPASFAKRDGQLLRSDLAAVRAKARRLGRTHPGPSRHPQHQPADCRSMNRQREGFMRLIVDGRWPPCSPYRRHTPRPIPTSPCTSSCPSRRAAPPTWWPARCRRRCRRGWASRHGREPAGRRRHDRRRPGRQGGARRLHAAGQFLGPHRQSLDLPQSHLRHGQGSASASACWPSSPTCWSCRRARAGRPPATW